MPPGEAEDGATMAESKLVKRSRPCMEKGARSSALTNSSSKLEALLLNKTRQAGMEFTAHGPQVICHNSAIWLSRSTRLFTRFLQPALCRLSTVVEAPIRQKVSGPTCRLYQYRLAGLYNTTPADYLVLRWPTYYCLLRVLNYRKKRLKIGLEY